MNQILRKAIDRPTAINERMTRNANNSIGILIFFMIIKHLVLYGCIQYILDSERFQKGNGKIY